MELGFETIGNATLICHDYRPVLVTDPWITGSAYFGSWTLSHQIPNEQMNSIEQCEFVWISHGHPDHLSAESLKVLNKKKILLPDHVGGLIFRYLTDEGYDVHIIKDRVWTKLSDRIQVLCLCDYNQDATLLVDINGRLIVNMNDGTALGWKSFVRKTVKSYPTSFYLRLEGVGDAEMLNFFDEDGNRILRDPAILTAPVGPWIAQDTEDIGAKFFIPFSSMHSYQRQDSMWIQRYATSISDYAKGFDSKVCEILPAFIKYDCMNDRWEKINPPETPLVIKDPREFGDDWEEQLDKADVTKATQYFQSIFHLTKSLDFINLRVGGKDNIIELSKKKFNRGITFEAPRHSLMLAINYEIFDDMLIGNFMKTTLHGKLKSRTPSLSPYFEPYVPKYADNGRAKSKEELRLYFKEYRKRVDYNAIFTDFLLKKFEVLSKNVFRHYFPQHSTMYQTAKRAYYTARRIM
jgi:hypothetical protein